MATWLAYVCLACVCLVVVCVCVCRGVISPQISLKASSPRAVGLQKKARGTEIERARDRQREERGALISA